MSKQLPLTQGKYALVDDADYDLLSRWDWYAWWSGSVWYARRSHKGKKLYLHREILKAGKDDVTDHVNHDGLDNRRCNIRVCTQLQNARNKPPRKNQSSKYKGVYWHKLAAKWTAQIAPSRCRKHLGVFEKEIDAAVAYDKAAEKYYGEFACLNFRGNNEE